MSSEPAAYNPFSERPAHEYFVGREEQLDAFQAGLRDLRADSPGHMFVAGLDGTGKTSFLARLKEIANDAGLAGCGIKLNDPKAVTEPAKLPIENVSAIIRSVAERVDLGDPSSKMRLADDWDKGSQSNIFRQTRASEVRTDLMTSDFARLAEYARAKSMERIVICVDEGQWLAPSALSAIKNALQDSDRYLVVLSIRVPALDGDAITAGRGLLDTNALAATGDIGASRFFITPLEMGPFVSMVEAERCITRRLEGNKIRFHPTVTHGIVQLASRSPGKIIRCSIPCCPETSAWRPRGAA
jgi:AAA ATPase domain